MSEFVVGQRVWVIDFRSWPKFDNYEPAMDERRTRLIGPEMRIKSVSPPHSRKGWEDWRIELEDNDHIWPTTWLRASNGLADLVQRYKEATYA